MVVFILLKGIGMVVMKEIISYLNSIDDLVIVVNEIISQQVFINYQQFKLEINSFSVE